MFKRSEHFFNRAAILKRKISQDQKTRLMWRAQFHEKLKSREWAADSWDALRDTGGR
ncbi:hypothetical protein FHS27_005590 [Rhodopirellula rubra]|uniref:Uncharacterized protein n=1 Tax=Aporhodopirellula rubra TaxID=980271 RepID=A0A7W5E3W9_9BACT|nr:hypothetical protein [Aporhodopirellula rubra]